MPELKYDNLNVNDKNQLKKIIEIILKLIDESKNRYELKVDGEIHFCTRSNSEKNNLTSEAGWYIIINEKTNIPLYVGTANNLNSRLNTKNGSRDNFGNPKRKSDCIRNILKFLNNKKIIESFSVIIIEERDFIKKLKTKYTLSKLDRLNVEKIISINRFYLLNDKTMYIP